MGLSVRGDRRRYDRGCRPRDRANVARRDRVPWCVSYPGSDCHGHSTQWTSIPCRIRVDRRHIPRRNRSWSAPRISRCCSVGGCTCCVLHSVGKTGWLPVTHDSREWNCGAEFRCTDGGVGWWCQRGQKSSAVLFVMAIFLLENLANRGTATGYVDVEPQSIETARVARSGLCRNVVSRGSDFRPLVSDTRVAIFDH